MSCARWVQDTSFNIICTEKGSVWLWLQPYCSCSLIRAYFLHYSTCCVAVLQNTWPAFHCRAADTRYSCTRHIRPQARTRLQRQQRRIDGKLNERREQSSSRISRAELPSLHASGVREIFEVSRHDMFPSIYLRYVSLAITSGFVSRPYSVRRSIDLDGSKTNKVMWEGARQNGYTVSTFVQHPASNS